MHSDEISILPLRPDLLGDRPLRVKETISEVHLLKYMATPSASLHTHSSTMAEFSKTRRNRAILSCNDCRRRKLKCDRLSPCNRCIKGGIAESCAYGPDAHSVPPEELEDRPSKKPKKTHKATRSSSLELVHISKDERDGLGRNNAETRPDTAAQTRLEQLERDIAFLQQHIPSQAQESRDQVDFLANSPEMKGIGRSAVGMGMLKGRAFATHFYGPSSAMSIIAHVSR
jgi:hypothetical protein